MASREHRGLVTASIYGGRELGGRGRQAPPHGSVEATCRRPPSAASYAVG